MLHHIFLILMHRVVAMHAAVSIAMNNSEFSKDLSEKIIKEVSDYYLCMLQLYRISKINADF